MDIGIIVNLALILLFVLIFVFFYIKDGETSRRISRYEKSLDDLNKEVYKIQKFLKNNGANDLASDDFRNSLDDVYAIIEKDREYVDSKLANLEEKINEMNFLPSTSGNVDDRRIISMFKDGWSVEAIARELMISKSEVEYTLKLAQLG